MWFHIQFLFPINYLPIWQDRRLRCLILVVWPFSPNREAGLWLSLGGFQEKGPDDKHIYNTHVLLDDSGNICSVYRKIHLYTFSPSLYIFYIKYLIFQYIDSGLQGVIHNWGHSGRFDVDVPGGPVLVESNSTAPGKSHSLIKPIPLSQMILLSTFPGWFFQLPVSVSCTKVLWCSFFNLHHT